MACFAKGPNTVKELEDRFRLDLSDEEAFSFADELVAQSIGNWRTDTYDYWQKLTVGIVQ
jgi:phosphatidylinositol kinase/protein kinase (PI-3  family)